MPGPLLQASEKLLQEGDLDVRQMGFGSPAVEI
jgi:hypothetical protein